VQIEMAQNGVKQKDGQERKDDDDCSPKYIDQ
jgi:hypothetical protein